jgi:hypothetical protein
MATAGTIASRAYAPKPGAAARPAIVRKACQQLAGGKNTGETLLTQNRKHYHGTRLMAYRAVDHYVHERVRSFLRRRHKVSSRGIITFSDAVVFGKLGVLRLRDVHLGRLP